MVGYKLPRIGKWWRLTLSKSVLIVDDAEFMRVMLRDIVEGMGYTVVGEAADGKEAINLFSNLQPELVLLDITMPEMDGTEALKSILAEDAEATVVMITALGQKEQVLSAIKAGARDFIIKPFDHERVVETLHRINPALAMT
jgi:two-component system chemotaxis response regulator CheY